MSARTQKIGLIGATSYVINSIVGCGIFLTPSIIYRRVNSVGLSLVIWLVSALISIVGSFCFIELGTAIRLSGGNYAYMCFMRWYSMAFSFMLISCFLSGPISLGIITDTFGEYAIKGFGVDLDQNSLYWTKHFLGFSLIFLLIFMNFFSLKHFVQKFSILSSIIKFSTTMVIILVGFYFLIFERDIKNFVDPFAHSNWDLGSVLTALFSGLYTYDGWDVLNMGIEEIENPRRNFPLAMLIGLVGITFVYLAINVAYFVILDGPTFSKSSAVAFDFANVAFPSLKWTIPLLVCLLIIGSINSNLFSSSRYIQAVSRSGMLPSCLSCINPTCESPRCALFIYAFFAIITSFLGSAEELINYISYLGWAQRAIVMGALIWIKLKDWEVHPETIRMPIVVPIFFCVISVALVVAQFISDFGTSMIGALVFGLGIIVFILFMTENALPRFDAYRKFIIFMNDKTTRWVQIVFNVMPEFCELGDRNVAIGRERDDSDASVDEAVANSTNRQEHSNYGTLQIRPASSQGNESSSSLLERRPTVSTGISETSSE